MPIISEAVGRFLVLDRKGRGNISYAKLLSFPACKIQSFKVENILAVRVADEARVFRIKFRLNHERKENLINDFAKIWGRIVSLYSAREVCNCGLISEPFSLKKIRR